jgi:hypothetical protein
VADEHDLDRARGPRVILLRVALLGHRRHPR